MKITIEFDRDELLPHQRGALAMLLNPTAPAPLVSVRGEEREVEEFVGIKRADVRLRAGDKVVLRDGTKHTIDMVDGDCIDPLAFDSHRVLCLYAKGADYLHSEPGHKFDAVSVNGTPIID